MEFIVPLSKHGVVKQWVSARLKIESVRRLCAGEYMRSLLTAAVEGRVHRIVDDRTEVRERTEGGGPRGVCSVSKNIKPPSTE